MPLPTGVRLSVARWLWLLPIAVGVSLAMLVLTSLSAIDRGESPGDLQEAETFLLLMDEVAVNARRIDRRAVVTRKVCTGSRRKIFRPCYRYRQGWPRRGAQGDTRV